MLGREVGTGLAQLRDDDTLVDLGCGNGEVLLTARASNPKCRIIGVEIDGQGSKQRRTWRKHRDEKNGVAYIVKGDKKK